MENTGQVSESGSSTVKHALNPDKTFMQVHYLKVRGVRCASSRQGMMGEAGEDGKIWMFLLDVLGAGCVMDVAVAVELLCIVFGGSCFAVFTCLVLLSRVTSSSGSWPVKSESDNSLTSSDYL